MHSKLSPRQFNSLRDSICVHGVKAYGTCWTHAGYSWDSNYPTMIHTPTQVLHLDEAAQLPPPPTLICLPDVPNVANVSLPELATPTTQNNEDTCSIS